MAAVWYEGGRRRQCESVSEAGLAGKLEKVTERLAADAPGMERPGSDLIGFYLSPDRHAAGRAWSRKHADTQRRLCARYLAPVIGHLTCQDIAVGDIRSEAPEACATSPYRNSRALAPAAARAKSRRQYSTAHGRAPCLVVLSSRRARPVLRLAYMPMSGSCTPRISMHLLVSPIVGSARQFSVMHSCQSRLTLKPTSSRQNPAQ